MNIELFITKRIAFSKGKSISGFIVKIAIAAIALSMAVMVITTATVNGFQNEIKRKIFGFFGHVHVTTLKAHRAYEDISPISKNQDFYPDIDTTEAVRHVQVFAHKAGVIKTDENIEGIVAKGVGGDFDWEYFKDYIVDGKGLAVTDTGKNSKDIMVSLTTANRLSIKTGDKITIFFGDQKGNLRPRPFVISGIYKTGIEEHDEQFVLIDIKHIQRINGWEKDEVGGFEVFVESPDKLNPMRSFFSGMTFYITDYFGTIITNTSYRWHMLYDWPFIDLSPPDPVHDVAEEIHYLLPNELNARTVKEKYTNIFEWLQLQDMNQLVILVLMAAVAIINMITVLLILILERTNMIGILKSLGASSWKIQKIFLYNAAYIVGAGLLIGNLMGIGVCFLQQYFGIISLPEESYYITVAPVDINYAIIAGLNAGTLLICLIVLIIPSYLVASISPVKAIRFS